MKMEKIYPNADLKLVSKVELFAGSDDTHLYFDEDCAKGVSREELLDLAVKGLVAIKTSVPGMTVWLYPIVVVDGGTAASVTVLADGDPVVYYSSEYTA